MNKFTNKKINPQLLSPNDILDDIYIVYKNEGFINLNIYLNKGQYRRNHIDYHFNSFNNALKLINLRNVSKSIQKPSINREDLIKDVLEIYNNNKYNFTKKLYLEQGKFKERDINEVFGTFTVMKEELNLYKYKVLNEEINKEKAFSAAKELLFSEGDLTESLFFNKTNYSVAPFKMIFKTFSNFLVEAGLFNEVKEKNRQKIIHSSKTRPSSNKYQFKDVTKEELIKDILKYYSQCEEKFTSQYYYQHSQFTRGLIKKYFGSFSEMLKELNLQINTSKDKHTKEEVVSHMVHLYNLHGKLTSQIQREDGKYAQHVITKYFGSFANMKRELGIDNGYNRNITEEELLEDLMKIVKKYGEINTTLIDKEGKYSRPTYLYRLGGSMESIAKKLNIINSNPNSTISQVGKYCIHLFSQILKSDYELEKTFDWLLNINTNSKLRLDGYFKEYNLAIEYDGEQHYKHIEHFGSYDSFLSRQQADKIKTQLCKENGITLIRIRYNDPLTKEFLEQKLIDQNILKMVK